ncbi:hypothetical protein CPB83DRAFT_894426 [Crepidotus variabilis]|uniref:Fe2OG dioxygenase domain-containing protein n=1 Tax=Crepidotus variabilis TaxID=179855 RepID=A0A9P6EG20_9AGAR|nr:hypothetical protein CPB83DRAFT_894426 [Crepidotus variabilis]
MLCFNQVLLEIAGIAFAEHLLVAGYRQPPFNTGVIPLREGAASHFYSSNASTTQYPTNAQLEKLANTCQPATFGINQQDVLDDKYRKAGKLDATDFATQFTPAYLGIVNPIYEHLLKGRVTASTMPIIVELYKLNVYGPGAFFKAHVDTLRSDKMFSSLVVVLPTVHEGGSLTFRRNGNEWTDVEHEVAPVTSGYRVTLTYNLYFQKNAQPTAAITGVTPDPGLTQSLELVFEDPTFLPNGGLLGLGLSHKYPFDHKSTILTDILQWWKDPDAGLKQLCERLSLKVAVKAVYQEDGLVCLLDEFYKFRDHRIEDGYVRFLVEDVQVGQGVIKLPEEEGSDEEEPEEEFSRRHVPVPIIWAKPLQKVNKFASQYMDYGNEASTTLMAKYVLWLQFSQNFRWYSNNFSLGGLARGSSLSVLEYGLKTVIQNTIMFYQQEHPHHVVAIGVANILPRIENTSRSA